MNVKKVKAFTLVEILIVVAILVILVSLSIPNVLRARITAQDALARNKLQLMSKASEIFGATGNGVYPENMSSLTNASPPYLNVNYCGATDAGYTFTCTNSVGGYTYASTPVTIGFTGTTTYSISTGGVWTPSSW